MPRRYRPGHRRHHATAAPSPASHSSGAARPAALLPFDINGPWTDNGSAKPVITTAAGAVVIDMSYAHRPTASGSVLDASSILVNFPDAGPYIGTFVGPAVLRWSNGSIWQKVYTGPTAIDLNDNWTDGLTDQHVSDTNGFIKVIIRRPPPERHRIPGRPGQVPRHLPRRPQHDLCHAPGRVPSRTRSHRLVQQLPMGVANPDRGRRCACSPEWCSADPAPSSDPPSTHSASVIGRVTRTDGHGVES